jgi:AcrR family transcriptional regulator
MAAQRLASRRKNNVSLPGKKNKASKSKSTPGRPKNKREQIVKAAIKVFLNNGYAASSMNQVAQEAGVIKATIYSHFADKQELFKAIIEEVVLKKTGPDMLSLKEQLVSLNLNQFFDKLTTTVLRLFKDDEYERLIRLVIGESGRFPEIADLYLRTVLLKAMEISQTYYKLHPELGIKDSLAAAHITGCSFWSLIMWQKLLGGEKYAPLQSERVKKLLIELIGSKQKLGIKPNIKKV